MLFKLQIVISYSVILTQYCGKKMLTNIFARTDYHCNRISLNLVKQIYDT